MVELKPEELSDGTPVASLYKQVVTAVEPFMGRQAEQFVRRQCSHINVVPENLTKRELESLASWMSNSARLVIAREKAQQLYEKVMSLAK